MAEQGGPPLTSIEVLTEEHYLVGHVNTGGRRFSTWLNLDEARTLIVDSVTLRSLPERQSSEVSLGNVLVNREAIVAVILREDAGGSGAGEPEQKPLEYVDKERHGVVVSAPPFALRGHIHVARSADLYRALSSLPGSFFPVTEARVIYTPDPELRWEGEVVLVNRNRAQLYWPAERKPQGQDEV